MKIKWQIFAFAVATALVGSQTLAQNQNEIRVEKVNANRELRITICGSGLRENTRVRLRYSNGTEIAGTATAGSTAEDARICARRTLPISSIPEGQNLVAVFPRSTGQDEALPIDIQATLRGQTTPEIRTGYTVTRTNGQVTAQVCDPSLRPGSKVEFARGAQSKRDPATVDANHCAAYQYTAGLFLEGNELLAFVDDVARWTAVVPRTDGSVAGQAVTARAPGTTPPPAANPPAPNPPATGGNRETVNTHEVRTVAERAGLRYAEAIAATLGQVDRIRSSFFVGFSRQRRQYVQSPYDSQAWRSFEERLPTSNAYMDSFRSVPQREVDDYENSGAAEGRRRAQAKGESLARADIANQVREALTNQRPPRLTPGLDLEAEKRAFQVERPNSLARTGSLQEYFSRFEEDRQRWARDQFQRPASVALNERWLEEQLVFDDLMTAREYTSKLNWTNWLGERAFAHWRQETLRPNTAEHLSDWNYYDRIRNSERVTNARDAEAIFRAAFIQVYERQLRARTERQSDAEAENYGSRHFTSVVNRYTEALARGDRLTTEFVEASKRAFATTLPTAYSQTFEREERRVLTEANIQVQSLYLVTAANTRVTDNTEVTLGDTFGVVVTQAVNQGGGSGSISLTVRGLRPLQSAELRLGGFDRLDRERSFPGVAVLEELPTVDEPFAVSVGFGNQYFTVHMKATFEGLVRRLAQTRSRSADRGDALAQALLERINFFLAKEWDDTASGWPWSNGYDNNKGDLKLERLAQVATRLPPEDQARLREFGREFVTGLTRGEGPGFNKSDDHDSALDILRRARIIN